MSTKRKYSVTVTPDKEGEKFTPSLCTCDVCRSMHASQLEWDTFTPTTELQFRMIDVVKKLEKTTKKSGKKARKDHKKSQVKNLEKTTKKVR